MEIQRKKLIGQGNTAEIYQLEDHKILKLYRRGLPNVVIQREYQNGLLIQAVLDQVPKVFEMVEQTDRLGIVFEEIRGKDMLKVMLSFPWKINAYSRELAHERQVLLRLVTERCRSIIER